MTAYVVEEVEITRKLGEGVKHVRHSRTVGVYTSKVKAEEAAWMLQDRPKASWSDKDYDYLIQGYPVDMTEMKMVEPRQMEIPTGERWDVPPYKRMNA